MSRSTWIATLIIKFNRQELTTEEAAALTAWKAESEENRLLFEQLTDEAQLLKEFKEYYEAEIAGWHKIQRVAGFGEAPVPATVIPVRNWWKVAAVLLPLLGLLTLAIFLWLRPTDIKWVVQPPIAAPVNIVTAIGKRYTVKLPDGTVVQLNAASRLLYTTPLSGKERTVVLWGEAYFTAAENKAMPFVVLTINPANNKDTMRTRVVGTEFNVKAYNDKMPVVITVLKGNVTVQQGKQVKDLTVNEQAVADTNGLLTVQTVNTNSAIAWTKDSFDFEKGASVQSVMNELKRWYGIKVEYRTGTLPGDFKGSFPRSLTLKDAVGVLNATNKLKLILKEDSSVIVSAKNDE